METKQTAPDITAQFRPVVIRCAADYTRVESTARVIGYEPNCFCGGVITCLAPNDSTYEVCGVDCLNLAEIERAFAETRS